MILSYELHYIKREIETHGTKFSIYRKVFDKYKQDTGEYEEITEISGLFHTEKGYVTETSGDFGTTRERGNPKLLVMMEESQNIKVDDFTIVNGNVYKIVDKNNVAELNVVCDLSMEVVLNGWETSLDD